MKYLMMLIAVAAMNAQASLVLLPLEAQGAATGAEASVGAAGSVSVLPWVAAFFIVSNVLEENLKDKDKNKSPSWMTWEEQLNKYKEK